MFIALLVRDLMVELCRFAFGLFGLLFILLMCFVCLSGIGRPLPQVEHLRKEMQDASRKQAEEHAQVMKELAEERTRTRALQRTVAKQVWQSARTDKGLSLSMVIQRKDPETAHRLLDEHDEDAMDCGVADSSGMTWLHHAARSVNQELVMKIKSRSQASMDALTYHSRTPSQ